MKQWSLASEGTRQKGKARSTATPDPATFLAVVAAMETLGSATCTSHGRTHTVCFCQSESWNLDLQSHNQAVCFLNRTKTKPSVSSNAPSPQQAQSQPQQAQASAKQAPASASYTLSSPSHSLSSLSYSLSSLRYSLSMPNTRLELH